MALNRTIKKSDEVMIAPAIKSEVMMPLSSVGELTNVLSEIGEVSESEEKTFLPYAYLTNEKTEGQDPWCLLVAGRDGQPDMVLQAPIKMCHLATAPMIRMLEGDEYCGRFYPVKREGMEAKTAEKYAEIIGKRKNDDDEEMIDGKTCQFGYTHLVAVWAKNLADPLILTIEAMKSTKKYWKNALTAGDIRDGRCATITVTSHVKSVKKSKKGYNYLSARKFKSWEPTDMSKAEQDAVSKAWDDQAEGIEAFLVR